MAKRSGSGQSQDSQKNLTDQFIAEETRKQALGGIIPKADMEAILADLNPKTKATVGTTPVEDLQNQITAVSDLDVADRTTGRVIKREIPKELFPKEGRKNRVMSPARAEAIARKVSNTNPIPNISAQDRVNIQQAGINAKANEANVPKVYNQTLNEPVPSFETNEQQDMYGGGLSTVMQDDQRDNEWSMRGQQPIANMLAAVKKGRGEKWTDKNIAPIQSRVGQDRLGYSIHSADELAGIIHDMKPLMEKRFNPQMVLKSVDEQVAMENSLRKRGYTDDSSLTHFMYHIAQPASENMKGSFPAGLIGAMYLATIQKVYEAQIARDKKIDDIDYYPDANTQEGRAKQFAALTDPQRAAIRGLEREAWNEQFNSEKNIGFLVAQQAGIKMTGEQMALMGMVALESVKDFAPNTITSRKMRSSESADNLTPLNTREQQIQDQLLVNDTLSLNPTIKDWVEANQTFIKTLLQIPMNQIHIGDKGKKDFADYSPEIRTDFVELELDSYYGGKDFTDKDKETAYAVAQYVRSQTPFTVMGPQLQLFNLMFGMDNVSEEFTPNSITPLFDMDANGFLNIEKIELSDGTPSTVGNREKTAIKIHSDGTEEEIFWGADTEKDNKFINNITWANRILGSQFRTDYFSGGNGRFYESAFAFHTDDKWSRSMRGAGVYFPYYIDGKSKESLRDLMDLKGAIIKNSGIKIPETKEVKFESVELQYAEEYFDQVIREWETNYGTLVEIANAFMPLGERKSKGAQEKALTFDQKNLLRESFKDPDSELSLASKALIEYSKDLAGVDTIKSVVEGIQLKWAIDKDSKVYRSNFMYTVDGTNNGPAHNSMKIGYERLLEGTGVTPYLVNASLKGKGFKSDRNLLAGRGTAYQQTAESTFNILSASHNPTVKKLAGALYKYGAISTSKMKKSVMPASYGVGKAAVKSLAKDIINDMIVKDPYVLEVLKSIEIKPEDAALKLGNKTWSAIVDVIGPLQAYTKLHRDFMLNILEQFSNAQAEGKRMPNPFTYTNSGRLIPFGLATTTAHGDTFSYENIGDFTQVTNVLDPLGKEFNKITGLRKEHFKALTAMNPVITHLEDTDHAIHVSIRELADNPAEKYGLMGGVAYQKYDGWGIPPKLNQYYDKVTNEEHINIGFKSTNFERLIKAHNDAGYDMNYVGSSKVRSMRDILGDAKVEEAKGRAYLMDKALQVNQFPVNGGAVLMRKNANRKLQTKLKREDYITQLALDKMGVSKKKDALSMLDDIGKKIEYPIFEMSEYKVRKTPLPKLKKKVDRKVWSKSVNKNKEANINNETSFVDPNKSFIDKKKARNEIKDIKYQPYQKIYHPEYGEGMIAWTIVTDPDKVKTGAHPVSYAVRFDSKSWETDANFSNPGPGTFASEETQPEDVPLYLYSQDELFSSPELARKRSGSTGLFDNNLY